MTVTGDLKQEQQNGDYKEGSRRIGSDDSAPGSQVKSDVDHVICHDAEAYPALHAGSALVAGSIQSMPSFEDADAAFATGSPLLSFLEPALLLLLFAFLTFGGPAGYGHALYAHCFGRSLVGGGIAGALVEDLAVDDNPVFRFLDFDHPAELGWLTCFA